MAIENPKDPTSETGPGDVAGTATDAAVVADAPEAASNQAGAGSTPAQEQGGPSAAPSTGGSGPPATAAQSGTPPVSPLPPGQSAQTASGDPGAKPGRRTYRSRRPSRPQTAAPSPSQIAGQRLDLQGQSATARRKDDTPRLESLLRPLIQHPGRSVLAILGLVAVGFLIVGLVGAARTVLTSGSLLPVVISPHWQLAGYLVALLLVAVAVTVFVDWQTGAYPAALIVTAALIPTVAAFATVFAYVSNYSDHAVLVGLGVALLAWLAFPLFYRRFASASLANPRIYGLLRNRLDELDAVIKSLSHVERPQNLSSFQQQEFDSFMCMAYKEAASHRNFVDQQLTHRHAFDGHALPWVLGTGYTDLWSRIHRADEALIAVAPRARVVVGAVYDELRLQHSKIPNADQLVVKLRHAVKVLSPAAAKQYLISCPDDEAETARNPNRVIAKGSSVAATVSRLAVKGRKNGHTSANPSAGNGKVVPIAAPPSVSDEIEARAILRDVRNSINAFRDSRWDGLVEARNRLIRTGILTSILTFVLLAIAINNGATRETITGVAVFYLVGALAGLFDRLRSEARSQGAVHDYGLTTARLVNTPLFSGIAAVGGILLLAMLPVVVPQPAGAAPTTPAATQATPTAGAATVAAGQNRPKVAALETIFNLESNGFGLVLAAIFGLTPSVLIERLKRQTEVYKADLQSTEATAKSQSDTQTTDQG